MSRNLKYQFKNAIERNFKEKQDKHSIKHTEGIGHGKIFSYSDRRNLIDVSSNLANYITENYKDVKMIKDIREEHIQAFFYEKATTCSNHTLIQYQSKLVKLEKLVNNTYNIQVNLSRGYVVPNSINNVSKLRSISMSRHEYDCLLEVIKESKSSAKIGIQLCGRFGLRVSEIVKMQGRDIDIDNGVIHIVDSKGGRSRDIPMRDNDRAFCDDIKAIHNEYDRIVPLKEDSVNRYLNRKLRECGLGKKYSSARTGIHSIRKMVAQEYYNNCRANGMNQKESLDATSKYLGHGENRDALMREYVLEL